MDPGITTAADLTKMETCDNGTALQLTGRGGTHRGIKSRQAQMMAIGGCIGTGLFLGSGQALAVGGPGFLLLAYCLTSLLVYGIVTGITEIATHMPISGCSTGYYCTRYVSPSLGFALGWLYFYSFGIIVAYEITAAGIIIGYWPNSIPIAVWITIMIVVVIGLNLCPVGVYAETEFWFASIKIIMIIGLLILSLIIMLGGGPTHDRLGFRYWNNPGAVKEYILGGSSGRFTAFLWTWIFSGFSFYFGPELIIFTAGEMRNPRKNLPIASRRYFARLVVFYVASAFAIGVTCPSNAEDLVSGAGNAKSSAFVVAVKNASIPILPSIINAVILTSAWSSGNALLYMSSRSLYSLAVAGNAPKIFTRCNRYGLPIYAVLASSCFAFLAYLNVGAQAGAVFNWFISLTNTAGYTSWTVCAFTYIRFRKATEVQGVQVPFRSRLQPYASYVCMVVFFILLLLNGFTVFYPGRFTATGFLTTYLGIPIFLTLWLGHKLILGRGNPWFYKPDEVDLTTGLAEVEADAEMWTRLEEEEKARSMNMTETRGPVGSWLSAVGRKVSILWQ